MTVVAMVMILLPGVANAATTGFGFAGDAYGTNVQVGDTVKSGPSALVTIGCTRETGVNNSNTVATVNVPNLVTSATVKTTAASLETSTGVATRTTAEIENLRILGGLVRADLLRAVSTTSHNGTRFSTSAAGSTFANLVVGTTTISAEPAPNTRINLAGLGYVVLNEQKSAVGQKQASMTVNMIHVFITIPGNLLGIETGTEIIVSHARSALVGPVVGLLDGRAYGTRLNVGSLVTSGPSAVVYMPCTGTNGNLRTNEILTVNVPGVINTGTVRNTAQGSITATTATGETTSTIESLDLLNGLVTATVIKADAHASLNGGTPTFSDAGSGFLTLSVLGHPQITADVGPNTRVTIAGLGTLYLHRVIRTANSIEVRMIELVVGNGSNIYGLALGSRIQVAVASASVHP